MASQLTSMRTLAMPRRACWWIDLGVEPDISPNALSPSVTHPVQQSEAFVADDTI